MSMICELYAPAQAELEQLLNHPEEVEDLIDMHSDSVPRLGLEKTWHGLHYLLTGSAWEGEEPLCFLVSGGEPVGDIDLGYGPARAYRPTAVAAIATAMEPIGPDQLRQRFNPAEMMREEIYPSIWNHDPSEDDTLGELVEYFGQLKEFLRSAADQGRGLVVTLG